MRFGIAALLALSLATPVAAQEMCPAFGWVTLGTAGGPIPTPDRTEPANLLVDGDRLILVDTGDGTANQLARTGRNLGQVGHVFLSHLHWDHTGGLAAVIGLRWMNTYPGVLHIYGPPGTQAVVDGIIAALQPPARIGFGLGRQDRPPADGVMVHELANGAVLDLDGLAVRAAVNTHFDEGSDEASGTLSLSYRFERGARAITYTGDTGPSDAVTRLATGSDLLVSEVLLLEPIMAEIIASRPDMPEQTRNFMRRHMSTHHIAAEDVGRMATAAGVARLVLTHYALPPQLQPEASPLRAEVRAHYAGPVELARDLASFDVGCDGE